jgi:hypothetical protein
MRSISLHAGTRQVSEGCVRKQSISPLKRDKIRQLQPALLGFRGNTSSSSLHRDPSRTEVASALRLRNTADDVGTRALVPAGACTATMQAMTRFLLIRRL